MTWLDFSQKFDVSLVRLHEWFRFGLISKTANCVVAAS